jgi:transposase
VIDLATESRPDILRQTAQLLAAENERLHRRLVDLTRELALAKGQTATQLELEIARLQEQLAARNRQLFGTTSEKRARPPEHPPPLASDPQRGHGPRAQRALPSVERVHELDEPDRICPKCGGDLRPWEGQFEESEEVDVVERSFRLVRHKRQKYRCGCGECVDTALGPDKLIAGGRYSIAFAIEVAIAKYADHLPLARQVRIMQRAGLRSDSQTLWDQLWALSRHLLTSYEALRTEVLGAAVIGADETTWRLMDTGGSAKWWVWAISSAQAVYYRLLGSRSAQAAGQVLGDYGGIVIADGYSAYQALQKQRVPAHTAFELAACWAHARRRFVEAEPNYPEAKEVIDLIGDLYEIEARARAAAATARWNELRQGESKAIVDKIKQWLGTQRVLPRSSMGEAISYTVNLWPALTRFVDNPAIPLDNNATERALRGVALGRKNHYGSRSLRGTEVAALFYSLIESAKLAGIEPAAYLREATRRAVRNPGTITLPHHLVADVDTG